MSDAADELQAAVFAALNADAGLAAAMGGTAKVVDFVEEREAMPYVQLDEPGTAEWDVTPTETDDGFGKEHTFMVHVWSDYEGKKELNTIMRAVELALRDLAPTLTGHRLVNIRYQFSDRLRDPDGQAYHGVMQFRAVTEET